MEYYFIFTAIPIIILLLLVIINLVFASTKLIKKYNHLTDATNRFIKYSVREIRRREIDLGKPYNEANDIAEGNIRMWWKQKLDDDYFDKI